MLDHSLIFVKFVVTLYLRQFPLKETKVAVLVKLSSVLSNVFLQLTNGNYILRTIFTIG